MQECLEVNVVTVPEEEFLESIMSFLKRIAPDKRWVILALCEKTGNFLDPAEKAPVFMFMSRVVPIDDIMLQAAKISQISYIQPGLKMRYMTIVASEDRLKFTLKLPSDAIRQPDFCSVLDKCRTLIETR